MTGCSEGPARGSLAVKIDPSRSSLGLGLKCRPGQRGRGETLRGASAHQSGLSLWLVWMVRASSWARRVSVEVSEPGKPLTVCGSRAGEAARPGQHGADGRRAWVAIRSRVARAVACSGGSGGSVQVCHVQRTSRQVR